jgi:hypothetical protein
MAVNCRGDPSLALGMTWHWMGIREEAAICPKMLENQLSCPKIGLHKKV